MLVPQVRRSVPRWIEAFIWLGLIASGWLTVTSVQGASARFLTDSVTWGVGQIASVSVEILIAGVKGWVADHKYGIADAVLLLASLDVFLLAALESRRQAKKALPRVRLGEWFQFAHVNPAPASTSARRARQARSVAGGHPVDIRALVTAESAGPFDPSGRSSAPARSPNESQTEDASTRLAS